MTDSPKPKLREMRADDRMAVRDLVDRVGFDSPYGSVAARPERGRDRVADSGPRVVDRWPRPENPALQFRNPPPPLGWVIEVENRIVGHVGNMPQLFQLGERRLLAVVITAYIIEPDHRGLSLHLFARFVDQAGIDLLLATTASRVGGAVFKMFRGKPVPVSDYDQALFWITGHAGFAGAALRRKAVNSRLAGIVSWPAGAALAIGSLVRRPRRTARCREMDVGMVPLENLGEEFDDLWRRKLEEPPRLMAWRTSAALKWHYHGRDQGGGISVLCCRYGGELRGYLILARFDAVDIGLKRLRVVDMLVLDDEGDVIDALLAAAFDHGRALRVHAVELIGFPASIRRRMLAGRPYVRRLPTWPYIYRARDDNVAHRLENPDAWYPCPYDGDASL